MKREGLNVLDKIDQTKEVILITYPIEKDISKIGKVYRGKRVCVECFHSFPPEGEVVEGVCRVSQIGRIVDFLEWVEVKENLIIIAEKEIEIVIKAVSTMLLSKQKAKYAVALAVKADLTVKPSVWIASLFDYVLELGGELVEAVEEYIATGVTVTPNAIVVESKW